MKKQRKIKRIMVGVLLVCGVMMLAGCYSLSDVNEMAQYRKQGMKNAVNYIEDKYGFKAKITNVTVNTIEEDTQFGDSVYVDEYVYVDMEYEGKEFVVYINGLRETIEGYDNYQEEQITEEICRRIEGLVGKEKVLDVQCGYGTSENFVNAYYDGSNLHEIFGDIGWLNRTVISIVDTNIEKLILDSEKIRELFGDRARFTFLNYRSTEAYEEISKKEFNLPETHNVSDIMPYSLFIENYMKYQDGMVTTYVDFKLEQEGDAYITVANGSYLNVGRNEPEKNGGVINTEEIKKIYASYGIGTDSNYVCLTIPCKTLDSTAESIGTLWEYIDLGSNVSSGIEGKPSTVLGDTYIVDIFEKKEKNSVKVLLFE